MSDHLTTADPHPPDHFDQYGRGPLLRAYQDRWGDVPHVPAPQKFRPPLAIYGNVPSPPPTGKADVAFWKVLLASVVAERVKEEVRVQVDAKLEAVRRSYAKLREELRLLSDGQYEQSKALQELEERIGAV